MTARAARGDVVLALERISKHFGNTVALNDASLAVRRSTVHALVGENGAGKTTLMRIAFGLERPDSGVVSISGSPRRLWSAADAIAAGVGMVHQHFTNVPAMSVAENVSLGGRGRFNFDAESQRVAEIGRRTGLSLDPEALVAGLPIGAQQRLEIVKALARNARILILDEPTAVLAPRESDELLRWLRQFADEGHAVVLITHKLREALRIADDVTVLRRGNGVLSMRAADVTEASLATAMLGEDYGQRDTTEQNAVRGGLVVTARDVTIAGDRGILAVRGATFDVRAGEILGIAGVEGAGQRELLRALSARKSIASGTLILPQLIGFVPEDRHRDALALDFTVVENLALEGASTRRGIMPWLALRRRAEVLVRDHDIRGVDRVERGAVRNLSGGNQQKLVLARALDHVPTLLVVENPTRGLDIRAAAAVQERLRGAAATGSAVVMYSSDLDEVLSLSDRLLVIHGGVARETSFDLGEIGRAMLGAA